MANITILLRISLFLFACSAGGMAAAHHSIAAYFDQTKGAVFEIEVRNFRFINPHPYIIAVPTSNTDIELELEMDNRWELQELGFTEDTFLPGDTLKITGNPSPYSPTDFYIIAIEHPRLGFRYEANVRELFELSKGPIRNEPVSPN